MLEITNIYVDPFDPKDYVVFWEFSNQKNQPLSDFTFCVYRASDKNGKYKKVSRDFSPADESNFRDKKASKLDRWTDFFYKIKVKENSTNKEEFFGPGSVGREPSPSDKMIISHKRNQLLNFGRDILVFKQPRNGVRCDCYNVLLGKVEIEGCGKCGGTGFSSGYDFHYHTKLFFPAESVQVTTLDGDEAPEVKGFWTSNFPIIVSGDMIVDTKNDRYIVSQVRGVDPHGYVIIQRISARRVKRTDVKMKVPVPEYFKKLR